MIAEFSSLTNCNTQKPSFTFLWAKNYTKMRYNPWPQGTYRFLGKQDTNSYKSTVWWVLRKKDVTQFPLPGRRERTRGKRLQLSCARKNKQFTKIKTHPTLFGEERSIRYFQKTNNFKQIKKTYHIQFHGLYSLSILRPWTTESF